MLEKVMLVSTTIAVTTGLTSAVLAQNVPDAAAASNAVPKTVWQIDDNGTAIHQASQLQCPATVGAFHRTRLNLFGPFGLDVACDYQDVDHNEITLYIALRPNQEIAKEFDGAKAALVQRAPNATPLADNEQQTFTSTLDWRHLVYRVNGAARSGVWMTRLGGWNVEYRATFAANRTDAALEAMTTMTDTVVKTAGAHIASCQTLMPLQRQGQKNTNQSMFPSLSISGTLAAKDARLNPTATPNWCVVQPIMVENVRFLFWRNVANQNGGLVERLTPVSDNDPVIVYGILDTTWPGLIKTGDKPTLAYDIIVETPDQIDLVGVYEGRPPIGELVRFQQRRTVSLYGKIEKKDGKTDVYRAPL